MVSDPVTTGLLGLAFMFVLIIAQVPVGIAMGVVGVVGTGLIIGFGPALTLLATEPSAAMAAEGLAVIAMFLLMGNFAHVGGLSDELYRLAYVYTGHRRGGLIFATVAACAGFGAICGSSVATAATMARIALPQMLERGYAKSLAAGAIASGGTLGMIVPPSVVMIPAGSSSTARWFLDVISRSPAQQAYGESQTWGAATGPSSGNTFSRPSWARRYTSTHSTSPAGGCWRSWHRRCWPACPPS